jgi:hypothetical protein
MKTRKRTERTFFWLSVILYVSSFFLPAFSLRNGEDYFGWMAFYLGLVGQAVLSPHCLAWWANPALVVIVWPLIHFQKWLPAASGALIAFLISGAFALQEKVPGTSNYETITALHIGYVLWVLSPVAAMLSALASYDWESPLMEP